MVRCTAPVNGHRTASGRAACPACGGGSRGFSSYQSYFSSPTYSRSTNSVSNRSKGKEKARWSSPSSTILYTPSQIRTLTPVRNKYEERAKLPDLRDVFLCHA